MQLVLARYLERPFVMAPVQKPVSGGRSPWRSEEGRRMISEHPELVPGSDFLRMVGSLKPPASATLCGLPRPHWHEEEAGAFYHDARLWGALRGPSWIWLERRRDRWLAWGSLDQGTVLWHGDRWWKPEDGAWFWVKDGALQGLAAYRRLSASGAFPPRGVRLIYGRDGSRAAASAKGVGPVIFDCATGNVLFWGRPGQGAV